MSTNVLGLSPEEMETAESSAIAKEFVPLKSDAYDAEVSDIVIYTNQWGGEQARYTVIVKDDKGEDRKLTYRSDIGKKLKDGKINNGYGGRLDQFAYATGVAIESMSIGEEVEINVFGTQTKGNLLVGMKGKAVKALVRLSDDKNKDEGQAFKYSNDLLGVVALNGTEKSGENAEEKFKEAVAKTPIFDNTRKKKGGSTAASGAKTESGENVDDML